MGIVQYPENFFKLIFQLRENFTKPSFKHFQVVLSAILLGGPKKTLTSGIRLARPRCHFSNIHRFMSEYQWNIVRVVRSILTLINTMLNLSKQFVFALDDTLIPKYGKKIFGRGCHFDHSSKPNTPKYILGHNWVVLGLLYYWEFFSKWLCFPLFARLFIPEKSLKNQEIYSSRITIAIEMIKHLKLLLNQSFTLVADGLYAKRQLVRTCIKENITLISRLRNDAALYEFVTPLQTRGRGRPRKYGKRLGNPKTLGTHSSEFKTIHLKLYGEHQKISYRKVIAIWKPAGVPIQIVIVRFNDSKSLACFFCTDKTLSVERILTLVAARWSIETLFSDLKEHLGMKDWQVRVQGSVTRSVPMTCVATSLLMLWSMLEANQKAPEFWDVQPWMSHKSSPSMLDVVNQFKARCISKSIFDVLGTDGIDAQKYRQIETILRRAA
jgi:hypothetical protein